MNTDAPVNHIPGDATARSSFVHRDGRRLFVTCLGAGSPAVLLEAGAGESSATWASVRDALASFTSVCTYDRAGLGHSDPAPIPRTIQDMTDDLHTVMAHAQLPRPVILVGHSLGGLLVQFYTQRYPDNIAGLVLLDSPHPEQMQRFAAVFAAYGDTPEAIQPVRIGSTTSDAATHPEHLDFATALTMVGRSKALDNVPLVVLSHGISLLSDIRDFPKPLEAQLEQTWQALQRDLAHASTQGSYVVVSHSGHYIHQDEPSLVSKVIRQMIETVRRQA